MSTSGTVGIVLGLGLVGAAAFIFLRKPAQAKADPLTNLLAAAPGAIEGAGNVVSSAAGTGSKIIKSAGGLAVDIAVAPTKYTVEAGKKILSTLKFW